MPDLLVRPDINVRCTRYFIASAVGTCWHCQSSTRLIALGLPSGHQVLELDDDERPIQHVSEGTWSVSAHNALLFYIDYLPEPVRSRLRDVAPFYRVAHSDATASSYWANHCECCDSLLDDHDLLCEPEGAFLPTSAATAARVHLQPIDECMEAAAAGYAYEPEFFDAMTQGP